MIQKRPQGRFLLILSLCLALSLTGCGSLREIKFGAAGIGGTYHAFATSFSSILTAQDADLKIEVRTTAGSAANLRLLSQGYIQLAIAQADLTDGAYHATGVYKDGGALTGYRAVAALYDEACQVVVRTDSGITDISGLRGKTVSVGEAESGTEQNAAQILAAYGLSGSVLTTINCDYTTAAQKLGSGEIDAFFVTAGTTTTVVEETAKKTGIRLLPVDGSAAETLTLAYPFYTRITIPAGTYTGQETDVETLGVKALLLASDKLSDDQVQAITETLLSHVADLQLSLQIPLDLDASAATTGVTIPFHGGAAAYYSGLGITVATE